jgi:response regulator of citrate/malate metabolism
VQKALHGGVLSYLLKPFDQKVLTARLHEYRERRVAGISEQVDQSELDSVFGASAAEQVPEKRPKGITSETVALVIGSLSTAPEGTSAAECAAACGLSRVSARRYLEYLADVGRVSVSLRYATAGRPERRYVLKQAAE